MALLNGQSVTSVLGKILPWIGWVAALALAVYEFLKRNPIPKIGVLF